MPLVRGALIGRAVLERQGFQVADLPAETTEYPEGSDAARRLVFRTTLAVPLIHADEAIGVIAIRRTEVRPFTDRQIELLKTFANQAVIAIENARLFDEVETRTRALTDALDQQTATSQVLGVISTSPGNLEPVFQAMLANAVRLCAAKFGTLWLAEGGDYYRSAAIFDLPPALAEVRRREPVVKFDPETGLGRVVKTKEVVHVRDMSQDPAYLAGNPRAVLLVDLGGARTVMFAPMVKNNTVIGVLTIYRQEVRPFTDKQIALVESFASQAVIAIENTRLLNELRESLQQQTATADVLKVISRSVFNLQLVLDTLVQSAAQLCEADIAVIRRPVGDAYPLAATYGLSSEQREHLQLYSNRPDRGSAYGRALIEGRTVHIPDVLADPEFNRPQAPGAIGVRTAVGVPLMREGTAIGVLILLRRQPRPFTQKQIELIETFADQAVIAIENTRLFEEVQARTTELTEALEQQTATSEVLSVISSSQGELEPVFHAMLENAVRICDAKFGNLWLCEGDSFRLVTAHNAPAAWAERWQREAVIRPGPGTGLGRVARTRQLVHIVDVTQEPAYLERDPLFVAQVELAGGRTLLVVPMLKDDELIGTIGIYRQEVRPFSDRQIELLKSFASQAVIAIENTRLLNELRESLQQQTATADVLKVISRSAFDLQAVLDALVESAAKLCGGDDVSILRLEHDVLSRVAHCGSMRAPTGYAIPAVHDTVAGRSVLERRPIHVADLQTETEDYPKGSAIARELGHRTILVVPLLREGTPLGAISLRRNKVEPFSDKQIELVTTFADQAVIAIENTRLFEEVQVRTQELQQALDHQTATSELLRVISISPTDIQQVFDTVAESIVKLCGGLYSGVYRCDGHLIHLVAHNTLWTGEALEVFRRTFPRHPSRDTQVTTAILDRTVVEVRDFENDPAVSKLARSLARSLGYRSILAVPMLHEGKPIGAITVARAAAGAFSENEVDLLKTFGNQAVIAIENVRLFDEVQARNSDLTALGEVGRAVSSTLDLKVVLKTIVDRAVNLSGTDGGSIFYYREETGAFELGEVLRARRGSRCEVPQT